MSIDGPSALVKRPRTQFLVELGGGLPLPNVKVVFFAQKTSEVPSPLKGSNGNDSIGARLWHAVEQEGLSLNSGESDLCVWRILVRSASSALQPYSTTRVCKRPKNDGYHAATDGHFVVPIVGPVHLSIADFGGVISATMSKRLTWGPNKRATQSPPSQKPLVFSQRLTSSRWFETPEFVSLFWTHAFLPAEPLLSEEEGTCLFGKAERCRQDFGAPNLRVKANSSMDTNLGIWSDDLPASCLDVPSWQATDSSSLAQEAHLPRTVCGYG